MVKTRWIAAGLLAAFMTLSSPPAEAVVVERVVAVVGEKALLLTDLRKRAQPFLLKLYAQLPAGPQRAAAESKILSQLIDRMVDEELEALAALRANTVVTAEEINKAMRNVARAGGLTLAKLYDEVERSTGMSRAEYRQEIRRQVLEGKLLNRMIQNQRVSDRELEAMFERVVEQERKVRLYHPAWIVLRIDEARSDALATRMAQARDIVKRVRGGGDFGELARQFSDDAASINTGGDVGIRAPAASPVAASGRYEVMAPPLERVLINMEPGDISEPLRFEDAVVILTLVSRQPSRYTSFSAARAEMTERVRTDKLQSIKEKWLKDLRRRTFVDIRL